MTDHSKPHDGGPAFPISDMGVHGCYGMTLRDWFAGQAPITIANACSCLGYEDVFTAMNVASQRSNVMKTLASLRFSYADAMLAARDRKAEP